MVAVKDLGKAALRWEQRSANASADYVTGSENPKRPWAQSAIAAEPTYKTTVVAAANAGLYGKGIQKAGDAKHLAGIKRKGKANYETGTAGAGPMWQSGWQPYGSGLGALTLPNRGAKGSPGNYQRSQLSGDTQHKIKMRLSGASI
jgi:hypothetical protein